MEKEGHSSDIFLRLGLLFAAVSDSPKVSELYMFTVGIGSAIGMQRGQAKAPDWEMSGKSGATSLHSEETAPHGHGAC
jgi:hypothetical protein